MSNSHQNMMNQLNSDIYNNHFGLTAMWVRSVLQKSDCDATLQKITKSFKSVLE
jgi:hypothetical protein